MSDKYILIDLNKEKKGIILDKASFFIPDKETKDDLKNNRKKWIRINKTMLSEIIGEKDIQCSLFNKLLMYCAIF